MWPTTRLTDLLGLRYPILQAPMLGSCTPDLAAAVTGAGGLGGTALGVASADDTQARIAQMRQRTNGAFNVNLFVTPGGLVRGPSAAAQRMLAEAYAQAGLDKMPEVPATQSASPSPDVIDLLADERVPVVSFHFGLPDAAAMARLKEAGCKVLSTASTVAEARALQDAGADAIIAQGWEAGGHRGSHEPNSPDAGVGTMALVPQVVDAVAVPVIAAGGIGDARGIVAALALGASGVQMGTAFLRCVEAATDAPRRAMIAQARDTDTIVTNTISGRSARAVASAWSKRSAALEGQFADFPAQRRLTAPLSAAGDDLSFHLYGQAAALTQELPAADLMAQLVKDVEHRLRALGQGMT